MFTDYQGSAGEGRYSNAIADSAQQESILQCTATTELPCRQQNLSQSRRRLPPGLRRMVQLRAVMRSPALRLPYRQTTQQLHHGNHNRDFGDCHLVPEKK